MTPKDQARRMAEEVISLKEIVDLAKYYGMGGAYLEFAQAAIAAALVKLMQGQEPLTDSYVQVVPDKCDRIVWKNNYYHLPLPIPSQQEERVRELYEDKARIDWLESSETSHGFCHTNYGEFRYYAHQTDGLPTVRQAIDAARNKEQGK